jgi:cis-3-alkyl-4-acyloxetan-2-one decarboxylase
MDTLLHRWLGLPYQLAKPTDSGRGAPVVLLHGLGMSARAWKPLVTRLQEQPVRVVTFDVLGFGASPKPDWMQYNIDDHASAVIASIKKLHTGPVVLVGHSLGALIALRVARLRPDLIKHVILYEMPLYDGLPQKNRYKARLAMYYAFYQWVVRQQPSFGEAKRQLTERLANKFIRAELTPETWQPFIKSLQNSIMKQTAANDIQQLRPPADVIYGLLDMVVIRGKVADIFGKDLPHIKAHTITAGHVISPSAAKFLATRIEGALAA